MVVCKFFQQGTCRYGQYCRFQHINNFGANQGNGNKQFVEGKNIVLGVAEEVLAAERGGQWLLSCFGPLKEQPCIPGMEDVSPEEVRWEMYQAQKNGNVDQTKLQFQQLCQAMTAKREALKNPTHETALMLEKLQKTNRDSTFGGKTNFALSTSQMAQSASSDSGSNVFGAKSFSSAANPFGGGFSASSGTTSSIFGRTSTTNNSVFGAKSSFGGNTVFGGQTGGNTVFGGAASKSSAGVFGQNQVNMQTFAAANTPNNSVFGGGTAQTVFAQSTTFGSTSQVNSPFSMAQSGQSTQSVFGATTTATNSPFGSPSTTLFGAAKNSTNIFSTTATVQSGNSMFGGSSGTSTSSGSSSIFVQPKNTAAFGGAPVFGTTGNFAGNPQGALMFGGQANFENSTLPPNGVFGSVATVQSTTFGSNAQTTNSFGALAAPSATPFGPVVSTTNSQPFGTSSGPFGAQATSPFGRIATFGGSMQSTNESSSTFGGAVAVSSGESPFGPQTASGAFGTVSPLTSQPFGAPAFGNTPSTPFASTTSTTTTSNPFAPRSQQQNNSPFGIAATTVSSGGTFGQSNFGSITTASIIDETAYTIEGQLTDDDKCLYLSEQFVLGKIPLQPPTIELR